MESLETLATQLISARKPALIPSSIHNHNPLNLNWMVPRRIASMFIIDAILSQAPPQESPMKAEKLLYFRNLFETEKQKLIYSSNIINQDFTVSPDELIDETDLTSAELETGMRMRLRNREALFIRKIEDALKRISEGTFGECEDCGLDIELRRLEARPTATLCVTCKEEQEHLESLHIDGQKPKSLGTKIRFA
jgi:DnaK suppressor protein